MPELSLENLKIANMKLQLHTADAEFEEKHPRDGGKFTTKGGGDSGKKDEKKTTKLSDYRSEVSDRISDRVKDHTKMLKKMDPGYRAQYKKWIEDDKKLLKEIKNAPVLKVGQPLGDNRLELSEEIQRGHLGRWQLEDWSTEDLKNQAGWQALTRDEREDVIRHTYNDGDIDRSHPLDRPESNSKDAEVIGDLIDIDKYDEQWFGMSVDDLGLRKKFENPKKTGSMISFQRAKLQTGSIQDLSLENLKIANMKLQLHTADAEFEEKHPRDGGKFTTKGGGNSGEKKDDPAVKKKSKAKPERVRNVGSKVDKSSNRALGIMTDEEKKSMMDYFAAEHDMEDKGTPGVDATIEEIRDHFNSGVSEDEREEADERFNDALYSFLPDTDDQESMQKLNIKVKEEISFMSKRLKKANEDVQNADKLARKLSGGSEFEQKQGDEIRRRAATNQLTWKLRLDENKKIKQNLSKVIRRQGPRTGGLISFQIGKLQTGSLQDQFLSADGGQYVSYFLINDKENLKGWGVTPDSIPRHIGSFKGMPFVITAKRFFAKSPYGEMTDHPSTDHFANLGIKVGGTGPMSRPKEYNDLMQQAKFQEEFRVGNIEDVFKKDNGDWHALIRIKPQFADMQMPNLVSPALFQINKDEPANAITTWVGMHLAGLDEAPAYGNNAIYTGSCYGTSGECLRKLSASMKEQPFVPCAKMKLASMNLKLAKIRLDILSAAMISDDHANIEQENQLCRSPSGQSTSCNTDNITHEI